MADITIKDIPDELHAQLQREAAANFRSLGQEAAARIRRTFDLDDRLSSSAVDRLIQEAIDSGGDEELTREQFDSARSKARAEFEAKHRAA
jgi:plasmid stability protein